MAQPYCTGAVHIFFGATVDAPIYLGACEGFPQEDKTREWDAVMNDITGSRLPMDYLYEGEEALVSCALTRWNQLNLDILNGQPDLANGFGNALGSMDFLEQGAMMGQEGLAFHLWLLYTFGASKPVAYPGLPAGKHYPQTIMFGPDRTETGTRPMKEHRIFRAWRQLDTTTRKMVLYDTAGLGALPALIE